MNIHISLVPINTFLPHGKESIVLGLNFRSLVFVVFACFKVF